LTTLHTPPLVSSPALTPISLLFTSFLFLLQSPPPVVFPRLIVGLFNFAVTRLQPWNGSPRPTSPLALLLHGPVTVPTLWAQVAVIWDFVRILFSHQLFGDQLPPSPGTPFVARPYPPSVTFKEISSLTHLIPLAAIYFARSLLLLLNMIPVNALHHKPFFFSTNPQSL